MKIPLPRVNVAMGQREDRAGADAFLELLFWGRALHCSFFSHLKKGVKSLFLWDHGKARLGSFQPHVAFGSFIKIPCRDYFFHLLQNIVAPSMCKNKDCPILSRKEWGAGREQHVSLVLLLTTEVPCPATFPLGFSLLSPCSGLWCCWC